MRGLFTALIVVGLSGFAGGNDDEPIQKKSHVTDDAPVPNASSIYAALKNEFNRAQAKHVAEINEAQNAVKDAKTESDKKQAQAKLDLIKKDLPGPHFAARFLEFSEEHPQDPMAFSAAMTAVKSSPRPATKENTLGKSLAYLQTNYAAKPQIRQLVRYLENTKYPAAAELLRDIMSKNPNHRIQGHACKALLEISTSAGEKDELNKLLKKKYVDLYPDLSDGKPVPEIEAKDVQGNNVRLSDFKGKVVVLDIWATWCPHCRAMIPHERAMVERLKNKPFALISISMDAKKEALTDLLAKEKLPWPQWWVGDNSNLAEDWKIEYFPTVYVIDAKGIIRHSGLIGEDLEKAVDELLKEHKKK